MDQWRQNTISQIEDKEHKSDLYQVMFFILLGLKFSSVFITFLLCVPRIRVAIFSKLNGISTRHNNDTDQHDRRPLVTLPPVQNNRPQSCGIEAPVVQNSVVDVTRQDGEGRSHTESEEIRHQSGNTTHPPEIMPSTAEGRSHIERPGSEEIRHENGNTTCQSEISPNTSRKQVIAQRHNSQTYQKMDVDQTTPFLSSSKNDTRLNPLKGDSVNGGVPHNELSSAGSSGYQALRHCPSTNDDTGYRSASRGID
ncbi:uncharacterized protein LOC132742593 [Ruditapes philippinarum]|uniref:uncharacterized protein LOC132742593 n=1 Tax=Ruditapes philippinarum TaxID=129788 RepID=UPI00295B90C7|nr:uncharacterized protein LOC132742593 [Ruditapes philippinarum]